MRFKFVKINFFFPWNAYKFAFDKFAPFFSPLFFTISQSIRKRYTQKSLHKHLARLSAVFCLPCETFLFIYFARWSTRKKVKLNYLWKYIQTEKRGTKNRRHFLNIKMMRPCLRRQKRRMELFFPYDAHRYIMIIVFPPQLRNNFLSSPWKREVGIKFLLYLIFLGWDKNLEKIS